MTLAGHIPSTSNQSTSFSLSFPLCLWHRLDSPLSRALRCTAACVQQQHTTRQTSDPAAPSQANGRARQPTCRHSILSHAPAILTHCFLSHHPSLSIHPFLSSHIQSPHTTHMTPFTHTPLHAGSRPRTQPPHSIPSAPIRLPSSPYMLASDSTSHLLIHTSDNGRHT